jgi:hypothetical protein
VLVCLFARLIGATMLERSGCSKVARSTPRASASVSRAASTENRVPMSIQKIGMPVSWQTSILRSSPSEIAFSIVRRTARAFGLDSRSSARWRAALTSGGMSFWDSTYSSRPSSSYCA